MPKTLPKCLTALDGASWATWHRRAADTLAVETLDGSEEEDGFSLDTAFSAYQAGLPPETYAAFRAPPLNQDA